MSLESPQKNAFFKRNPEQASVARRPETKAEDFAIFFLNKGLISSQ